MPTTKALTPRPPRPARPKATRAPLLDALDTTHRRVLVTLAQLRQLAEDLDSEGLTDETRAKAASICQFFDETAREHHAAEEREVFPALLASGDAVLVQHVQRLQQDHGWLEQDWLELQPHLRAVAEGLSGYDPDFLRSATTVFTDLYNEHIALEEEIVYPASQHLADRG